MSGKIGFALSNWTNVTQWVPGFLIASLVIYEGAEILNVFHKNDGHLRFH